MKELGYTHTHLLTYSLTHLLSFQQTVEAWRTIFFITLGIFGFEAVFYLIFGSGEQQEWAKPKPQPQEGEQQKLNDIP